MRCTLTRLLLGVLLVFNAGITQAVIYMPSLNEAQWRLELSPFECRMWQPIPVFGDAVFSHRAGESQQFYLKTIRQEMAKGSADLVSSAPVWDERRKSESLGQVNVRDAVTSVKLGKKMAFRLLNELYDGMSPVFTRVSWYEPKEKVQIGLSSVNFRRAYSQYQGCLASLLPVNYDQIKRTRLHFETAKFDLTPRTRDRLDKIIMYVKADATINGFYIDGHTDEVGRRLYNLELSKSRAKAVTEYLAAKGVDESMITTRYHGERYPVINNKTVKNRAQNRRVTVRLERDGV